ncbi:MAG: MFS transporter [Rhizomicrobium sp.]
MTATDTAFEPAAAAAPAPSGDAKSNPAPDVSNWRLALYALPSLPIAFLYLPVTLMMPAFYASALHLSLTAIGGFLLISRGVDVVLDPMIGKWSDGTRSAIGRRKLWMLGGTPLLMFGAYLLFMPPLEPSGWYLLIASFVIYAGGSSVGLPYSAWGTEITETYHGRSRMAGFREAAGVIGGLSAAIIPAVTGLYGHGVDRFTMSLMGLAIMILTPLTVLIAVTTVPEPPQRAHVTVRWLPAVRDLFRNGPFRILCGAYVLFNIGGSVVNATMVFFMSDYLKMPTIVGMALLTSALTTVAAVPAWLWISRRIGKHRAISLSLVLAVGIFAVVMPWIGPGQQAVFLALMCVLGAASSGYVTLPLSIIGDVIDFDTLKHRIPRGGLYWGVWSFAQKVTPALAIAVTMPLLKWMGFNPGGHNSVEALMVLKYTFCFGAVPFFLAGGALLLLFPINSRRHALIRRRLESRQRRNAA